jgi:DNA helicase-2/ATP-dependent DNA helicase PcrA
MRDKTVEVQDGRKIGKKVFLKELCKNLILDHRMTTNRMGFMELFMPLYEVDSWRTNFLNASLPVVRLLSDGALPLAKATFNEDRFAIARIVRNRLPLLSSDTLCKADAKSHISS